MFTPCLLKNGEETAEDTEDATIEKETVPEKIVEDVISKSVVSDIKQIIAKELEEEPKKEIIIHDFELPEEKLPAATIQPPIRTYIQEAASKSEEETPVAKLEDMEAPVVTIIQEVTLKFMEELLKDELPTVESTAEVELSSVPETDLGESTSGLDKDIEEFLQKLRQQDDFQAPAIILESEDVPHTLEVESLEKEVDDLIQEALNSIQQKETVDDVLPILDQKTNETSDSKRTETVIEKVAETKQPQADTPVLEEETSPEIDLKQEISEIEKLIQEVNDLPDLEPKLEVKDEVDTKIHTVEDDVEPTQELVSERIEEPVSEIKAPTSLDVVPVKPEEPLISEETKEAVSEIKVETNQELVKPQEVPILEEPNEPVSEIIIQRHQEKVLEAEALKPELSEKTDEITSKDLPQEDSEIISKKEAPVLADLTQESAKLPTQESALGSTAEEKVKPDEESRTSEPSSEATTVTNVTIIEKVNVEDAVAKPSSTEATEEKKSEDLPPSDKIEETKVIPIETVDDELGSDEELVEEIEEIVYEEESGEESGEEEEIEIEVEVSDDEIPDERNTNRTESSSLQRVNGERSEDLVEESKYTTVSGATAAENDISDEELTDNEEVEEDEEIIEVEEEIEDEDYVNEGGNDLNHISGDSDLEL